MWRRAVFFAFSSIVIPLLCWGGVSDSRLILASRFLSPGGRLYSLTAATRLGSNRGMKKDLVDVGSRVSELLAAELERLGRGGLGIKLCLSDAAWRDAMAVLGCPAWNARLASPTTRRGTRGKLGMATICHLRHGHPGVVYIRTRGRS